MWQTLANSERRLRVRPTIHSSWFTFGEPLNESIERQLSGSECGRLTARSGSNRSPDGSL